ncbi:tumor necrosis factor receptor superfamily member 1A [Lissotriton helveticus]
MGGCPGAAAVPLMLILGLAHIQAAKVTVPDVLGALLIHGAPIGDNNLSNYTWRLRRDVTCQEDEYKHPSGAFCCKMCLAGFRKVSNCKGEGQVTSCRRCEQGSYTEVPNYVSKCMLCDACRRGLGQIEISPCTTSKKTVCGCPGGEFQAQVGSDFQCKPCKECTNGKTLKICEGFHDTICQCNSGFFHDIEQTCRPCNECRSDECRDQCPLAIPIEKPVPRGTPPLLIALTAVFGGCLVLVGIWIVWKFYYRSSSTFYNPVSPQSSPIDGGTSQMETGLTKSTYLPGQPVQCSDPEVLLHVTAPCTSPMVSQLPDCVSDAGRTQLPEDPRVLYAVVDTVPPRRWKEFVRRLGLSDHDIELIEMQNRDCREGHYEMLQKWRCRTGVAGSTVEVISRVLREMDLSGCSEAIQDALHPQA